MKFAFGLVIISLFFTACSTLDVYEKSVPFVSHEWDSKITPSFNFDIVDTTSLYNISFVFRHEDAYRYKNIWLNIKIQDPDSTYTITREFTLADNSKWLGSGMDDIFQHHILFNELPAKLKKGKYVFTLQHIMREDPLQHVFNAGIRIDKIKP